MSDRRAGLEQGVSSTRGTSVEHGGSLERGAGLERGASLMEATITLAITALLLLYAGEGFVSAAVRNQGNAVTAEVAAVLRHARHFAMMDRRSVRVIVEPTHVRAQWSDTGRVIGEYEFGGTGVSVQSISNGPTVTFYGTGRSASPTTITLRNSLQESLRVSVAMTGRVTLQ